MVETARSRRIAIALWQVEFSVISDFVRPARRGLAMSFWCISQGVGGLVGGLLASQLGADDFRRPLVVIAMLGGAFGVLYLFTFDPPRGFRQPELEERVSGENDERRIERDQVPMLLANKTNRLLILQGYRAARLRVADLGPALVSREGDRRRLLHGDRHKSGGHLRCHLSDRRPVLDPRRPPRG